MGFRVSVNTDERLMSDTDIASKLSALDRPSFFILAMG